MAAQAQAFVWLEHDRRAEWLRWGLAGALVVAAHAGLMATYLMLHKAAPQGAPDAPAVIIDMAPLPEAPASPMDVAPGPEMVEAQPLPEPVVEEPPPPEPVIETPPPEPIPETPVVAMPEPPPPPPKPVVQKQPDRPKPEPKKVEKKKPAPRTTAAPRAERQTAERPAAPSIGAAESAAALATWRDMVVSQLQRAKRYPSGAESRREQGVATVSFTLSRSGSVLSRSLARSSGSAELDQEVLAMVQRAAPFPAFPASMTQASVHLSAPIRFQLR